MKKNFFRMCTLCIAFLLIGYQSLFSQEPQFHIPDSGQVQILRTSDGSSLIGRITAIHDSTIEFETDLGKMILQYSKILSVEDIKQSAIKEGEVWFDNPNSTRLYFAPNARTLKKGEGYIQNIYLFFASAVYGLTDRFTIGGGMSLLPGQGLDNQIYFFTPKLNLAASPRYNFAIGALVLALPDFDSDEDQDFDSDEDPPTVGILYGVSTWGNRNTSFTLGLGYGFVDNDFADKPMIVLGFERRVTRRTAFVTENWMMPGIDDILFSYGYRFFGEKLAIDFAFINMTDDILLPGVPYVDFVYNF